MTLAKLLQWAAEVRKFLVIALAVTGQIVTLGLVHGAALHDVLIAEGVVGAILVHRVPNRPRQATKKSANDTGATLIEACAVVAAGSLFVALIWGWHLAH